MISINIWQVFIVGIVGVRELFDNYHGIGSRRENRHPVERSQCYEEQDCDDNRLLHMTSC